MASSSPTEVDHSLWPTFRSPPCYRNRVKRSWNTDSRRSRPRIYRERRLTRPEHGNSLGKQGRCCCRRHFPSHVAVNVEGVWGKASLPQRTPVKQKATAIRDSTTNVRFCATVIRSSEKSVRSDAILYAELGEIPLEEVDREGAAGYFGSGPRFLFALQRHAFAICATTIRASAKFSVRVHADGIRVCAICRSFSRAQCTQNVPRRFSLPGEYFFSGYCTLVNLA